MEIEFEKVVGNEHYFPLSTTGVLKVENRASFSHNQLLKNLMKYTKVVRYRRSRGSVLLLWSLADFEVVAYQKKGVGMLLFTGSFHVMKKTLLVYYFLLGRFT